MSSTPTPRSEPLPPEPGVPAEPQASAGLIKSMSDTSSDDLSVRGTSPAREPAVPAPNGATRGKAKSHRASPPLPESFGAGRYRVERLLGRGGMGAVYFATDTRLNRPVAVKVPKLDDLAPELAEKALRRFQREVQAAAALAHPYVCHVYDVGDDDGVPFLAMEFIDGQPLSEQMQRPWPLRSAAELIAKVAEGIAAAHAKGIVHRDLKPANIMLDARGEPKVMDFGLAKRVDDDKLTRTGAMLGTPQYMPKEQVLGESHKIGPWTDVYSLGVILYELLTARLPFDGHTVPQLLGRLLSTEAIKPRDIRPDIDLALEAICLRGIGKEIAHRYASMTEFSAALRAYLGGTESTSPPIVSPASPPVIAMERAAVRGNAKLTPTVADAREPAAPKIPPPVTVAPNCPWCAQPLGTVWAIESRRAEPMECGNCRNVWVLSDDGTKWNQVPKCAEADTPSPADFVPMTKLPAADLASAVDDVRSSDLHDPPVPSSTQFHSPTLPTVSRRTLSRRQWIGVNVAALLLMTATMAVVFHRGSNSRNEAKFTDMQSFVVANSESIATVPDRPPQPALSSTDNSNPPTPPPFDEATLTKLIANLSEGSERDRVRAAREIGRFGAQSEPAVPALIEMLTKCGAKWELGRAAAEALGDIGPSAKAATTGLIAAVTHVDAGIQESAAVALQRILDRDFATLINALLAKTAGDDTFGFDSLTVLETDLALIAVLKDAGLDVGNRAALALKNIDVVAVPALIMALKDPNKDVRSEAASALKQIANFPRFRWYYGHGYFYREERRASSLGKTGHVPFLIAALKDADKHVQRAAVYALWFMGPDSREAVPTLITALNDKEADEDFRSRAASALGGIGPDARGAVPALIAALKDVNENVRMNSANALGRIGPAAKTAIPALEECLQGTEAGSPQTIIWNAISQIKNSQ